ncbi:hypothetical protein HAP41_0000033360 [Bradyrhizobium barranii subsp. apii]|uniref:Uncharacterized protein n=1 Tax=Bradyrhizobium barranii subsp. apii TaxID=2819348 RepID=A0A8T5V2L2_9BRAD|nr:hypothetical protein [Bradyrhizobium barranii]UPT85179.1 hypothetical protein HAP41_0000033360 [Bradyrhizobium barranii subsp. apii]
MALDLFGPTVGAGGVTVRPSETRAFTAIDTFFRDCSSPDLDDGTEFSAAWFNEVTATLRALARANGQTAGSVDIVTQDNADDSILVRAAQHLIQRGLVSYGEDASVTANQITAALTPTPAEYKKGMRFYIKAANINTGAATANISGLGVLPIVRRDGSALLYGDIVAGGIDCYIFDGTKLQLPSARGRPQLVSNYDLYVNGAIGNDANDGISNVAGHALATIQQAINIAFSYAPSQFAITIHIADGTYAPFQTPGYAGPNIIVVGNTGNPSAVVVQNPAGTSHCVTVTGPNTMSVSFVKVVNLGTAAAGGFVVTGSGATLNTSNTVSGTISTGAVFEAYGAANLNINGAHNFAGNCSEALWGMLDGIISVATGINLTVSTPITCGLAFAYAAMGGKITFGPPNATIVNPGNVTGKRYQADNYGLINTNGGGASYLPGTIAGSASNGLYL